MSSQIDHKGERYGRLLVLELAESLGRGARWLCRCDCGIEKLVNAKDFKTVRSCGCLIREIRRDLTGQRFGRLVVVEPKGSAKGGTLWLVKCDCGKEKILRGGNLINKGTFSCGCLKKEAEAKNGRKWALAPGESSHNRILASYIKGAKKRGLKWGLSNSQFSILISSECYWCGCPPSQVEYRSEESYRHSPNPQERFIYNGIDRVDSSQGYFWENCVSACRECNRMKGGLTSKKFLTFINRIDQRHQELLDRMMKQQM